MSHLENWTPEAHLTVANRLKPLMEDLVGDWQATYWQHCNSTRDASFYENTEAKKKGEMIVKIDLEKAYHRVNWKFLEEVLRKVGFSDNLRSVIMSCITSTSLVVIWNGEILDSFEPERGLRQGDSLSPYLFVLCRETLAHSINKVVERKDWKPVRATACSLIQAITGNFSIPSTSNLGMYLGMPLFHERIQGKHFQYLTKKMKRKMSVMGKKNCRLPEVWYMRRGLGQYNPYVEELPTSKGNMDQIVRRNTVCWILGEGYSRGVSQTKSDPMYLDKQLQMFGKQGMSWCIGKNLWWQHRSRWN